MFQTRAALPSTLLAVQDGVVSRRQLLALGWSDNDLERAVRRRELQRLMSGVYLEHTGPATWEQRAWAGVLRFQPAALAGAAALRADLGASWPRHDARRPIEIVVARPRSLVSEPGYRLTRTVAFETSVRSNLSPPRLQVEAAVLQLAGDDATPIGAAAILADACQQRLTTPERLLTTLAMTARQRRRAWIESVLSDIRSGVNSTLEHGYLTRVERPHGLPRGERQRAESLYGRRHQRDVDYGGLVVELDGRLFHDSAMQRDSDLDRDLDVAAGRDRISVRLGWGQVFERACRTAHRIALILRRTGWEDDLRRCGPSCAP